MSTLPEQRGAARKAYRATLRDVINEPEKDWDPLFLRGQIADAEEDLHLRVIWQGFGRWWLLFGNSAFWILAIVSDISNWHRGEPVTPSLYGVAITSTLASPIIVYQQYKRLRRTRHYIRKTIMILRQKEAEHDNYTDNMSQGALVRQRRYRNEMPDLVAQMRDQAERLRSTHNRYQTVIIAGSIFASAITTASVSFDFTRWISVGVTAAVGLAAGFTGYYKFHENSYNLRQTADAIEREYESVDLRVGRYVGMDDATAYSLFADFVERLRDEQNKRQQQLDQPVEAKREATPAIATASNR
jgi:Protein of unknown function (DUF4231)